MKSIALQLEEIASWAHLRQAWHTYRRGKRRRPDVAWFELNADRHLLHLSDRILAKSWRPGPYRLLQIREPKPRLIAVAAVADRVVQTAFHHALAPRFNRTLIDDCYACLPKRGSHRAMFRFQEFQRKYAYLLHLDIKNYYACVNHGILLAMLAKRIRDQAVMGVLGQILQSGEAIYWRKEVRTFFNLAQSINKVPPQGLPIGNLTSQWWGNTYLNGLDHFCKRVLKVGGYLRYMDDFVLFGKDPAQLRQWRSELEAWLWQHRKLHLKSAHGPVQPCHKTQPFLGYRISRAGFGAGHKIQRGFVQRVRANAGDLEKLTQTLVAYRGVLFI